MKNKISIFTAVIFLTCLIAGCSLTNSYPLTADIVREIASPARPGSFSPRVTAMHDGSTLLTWLEPENDKTAALRYSFLRDGRWSTSATIVAAQPFSRHPSEAPGVIALSKTNLIAYWSQKPPTERIPSQEVDVYFSVSTDQGLHWTAPTLVNLAGTGEESSYPSAAPVDSTHAALIWLDGRNWRKQKRVTLMTRSVQSDGTMTDAADIDPDTCTCCPTSMVQTGSGLLAAYRGHTPENIRDISLLQNVQGRWSQPRIVHADNWHFQGCPVNGPNLDVNGTTTALIWFSAPQDQPEVKVAFSGDGGSQFTAPRRVDEGDVIGRTQVVLLPGRSAVAFWVENKSGTTRLRGRRVHDAGTLEPPFEVARGVGLGYPHAARLAKGAAVTWADEGSRRIHFATVESGPHSVRK
jgi:hypothetical protein